MSTPTSLTRTSHAHSAVSPPFSYHPVGWPAPRASLAPALARRRTAAGNHDDPARKDPSICIAPQYAAEELLRAEGFTDVRYVELPSAIQHGGLAQGEVDFSLHFAAPTVIPIDAGDPITVLAGVHFGCFELFAKEHIRGVLDLKGKSVAIQGLGSSPHVFLSASQPTSGSTRPRTSTGSRVPRSNQ